MSAATDSHSTLLRRGMDLHRSGDLAGAARVYGDILATQPGHPDALHLLGLIDHRQGRTPEALQRVGQAFATQPDNPVFAANLGNIRKDAGDLDGAMASYRIAVALDPRQSGARNNLGTLFLARGSLDEAIECFRAVLEQSPDHARAWHNLGLAHARRGERSAAIDAQRRACAILPDFDDAWATLARLLLSNGQSDDAMAALLRWTKSAPQSAAAHADLAVAQHRAGSLTNARAGYERALSLAPAWLGVRCNLCALLQKTCDWEALERHWPMLAEAIAQGRPGVPLGLLVAQPEATPAQQLAAARANAGTVSAAPARSYPPAAVAGRLRVGYLSGDFREHATAYLTAELFELHDKDRFDVTLLSYGPDDGSPMRARLVRGGGAFIELRELNDAGAAARIESLGLDILVDLNGNTDNGRMGIAARRPAPVQVSWLGFPGTLGVPAYDYLMADARVIPPGDERWYAEQVVRLPVCYQSNDRRRARPVVAEARAAHGLPDEAIVLASFAQSFKITRPVFEAWLRTLADVPATLLWLLDDNPVATAALRRRALEAGVASERLVFAPRLAMEAHLRRYLVADFAVDTWPCSAHTTASDAVWMGCPLITLTGATFASRVATSVLASAGLADAAKPDLPAYGAAIRALAMDALARARWRTRTAAAAASPLFDSPAFARSLETAYLAMADGRRRGNPPAGFDVAP